MNKQISKLVIPNKKINFFTFSILILGFICGCIFLVMINESDKASIIEQISNYFIKISSGSLENGLAFKNSLIINYIYVLVIWILGFSIIGLILNIFVIYLKGFIVGFTISSMILTYGAKGILSSLIYLLFGQLINIFVIIIIGIYGFMFSLNLLKLIFNKKKDNGRKMMKKYIIILIICIVISFISSVLESFVLPNILKFIIGIYVS